MPIDAGAIGIRPVTQQRPTGGPEGVQRRDDGSSSGGFRPQTNVALKTAIEDLAGTLSKISSQEKFGIEKLPQEVGQIVKNILQQSFSMQETLSRGVGSTIESQRFSMEQLTVFARMLSQIGALADKGFSMELSNETQELLAQFKTLLVGEEGGTALEPVLMSKAAFELIDAKTADQLPQALYEILAQLAQASAMPTEQPQQSEGMQFLKQLIQYFMPRPSSSETSAKQEQPQTQEQPQQQQNQQQGKPQTWQMPRQSATQQFLQSMFRQFGDKFAGNQPNQQTAQGQPNQQTAQGQPNQQTAQGQPNQQTAQGQPNQQTAQGQPNQQTAQGQPNQQTAQGQPNQQTAQGQPNQQTAQGQPNQQTTQGQPNQQIAQGQPNQQTAQTQAQQFQPSQQLTKQVGEEFLAKQMEMREQMQTAKTTLLRQPLQNTPQTMEAMKSLAQMLMRSMEMNMTPRTTAMLQNFINNSQTMMPESEARHLQNLLRLCQQNVPITVQQAAVQQNLPDLPRLWAFMQLCDMARLTSQMTARGFKRAGKDVAEFANGMRQAMGGDNSAVQSQRSFQMMLPLYMGENETSYPTYLSVYDENEKDKETGEDRKETWVRICILTDNIGAVELTFRVYEENQLDMRFYFSQRDTANDFKQYIDDLTDALRDTELNVGEIRIGSVGEKMKLP